MIYKIYFFCVLVFSFVTSSISQTKDTITTQDRPKAVSASAWKSHLKSTLQANQTAFNNDWQGGGASNLAALSTVDYNINYKKGTWAIDNNIRLAFGITKIDDEKRLRKTNDNIELNSTLFKNIKNSLWSYSTFFSFKSQFAKGYKYNNDDSRTLISNRFSPAIFQLGPGFLFKKSDDFKINIAPSTLKAIVVDSFFTENEDAFGVDQGENSDIEFGASVVANYKFNFAKNVSIENFVTVYANYLGPVGNIDINYSLNMNSKINKYMSANFTFQAIYDEDTVKAVQVRELISLGLNYEI